MSSNLIFLSVPGLRPKDVRRDRMPTLYRWANRGLMTELTPSFPAVTSPVQASMLTGVPPRRHGVIANGFFDRARREVAFWVAHNDAIQAPQTWDELRRLRPDWTSAVWHAQNIKGAGADYIVTPAPVHEPDGTTRLWCYSRPDSLYPELLETLGHFPLQHYWGPLAGIESTRWILRAAAWLHQRSAPHFHWIYIPHLDYAGQKHGPDSEEARRALGELDAELSAFAQAIAASSVRDPIFLVAGEYAMTAVRGVVYPNRILRQIGMLTTRMEDDGEHIDLARSPAFAMVDHQFAHVYVENQDPAAIERIAGLFRGLPGVAAVHAGAARAHLGMDHPRAGDLVLIAADDHWFAYYWWLEADRAPSFARTVDIHRKPGYDPVELFIDPATRSIPLNPLLVRGSHGVPATQAHHRTALVCSRPPPPGALPDRCRDVAVHRLTLRLLGLT
jgi:predicted AlkP superfamily pyrophosphatase or phosphodiesterase